MMINKKEENKDRIIDAESQILITGATGFIGSKVVECLVEYGFRNLRCFTRETSDTTKIKRLAEKYKGKVKIDLFTGSLLSRNDCLKACKDAALIYHLAIGDGGKSFPNSFMNAVIPTRNLLEACLKHGLLRRFVNVSSFAVYSNRNKPRWRMLDESCPIDGHPNLRGDAYAFAKLKQDQIVYDYGTKYGVRYVILRPGAVYGPENSKITGRVGLDTFGFFMHLGGSNKIPFTYVDNCAEAIVLAGIVNGVDSEVFNIVDDDLPSSRQFLRLYKRNVRHIWSIYIPKALSYLLCYLWEKYTTFSEGQLPLAFSRGGWHAYWKKTNYSNEKIKSLLGWNMKVSTEEGLKKYFESCSGGKEYA